MGVDEMQNHAVEQEGTTATGEEVLDGVVLFGKYALLKVLGYGAFGKVYQAKNLETGQSVAIKVVSKNKVVKKGLAAQIEREIAIMHQLRHPHIIELFEVLATKTKIYFVMEFANGGELFHKVKKGRFSEDLSRRYFQQLLSAVKYCHSIGVYHRDLKLDNLLIDENMKLKVTDFGLGAVKDQTRPDGLLHTVCGTPAYVAPEILAKKGYDGAKVDVWSCGVILFVLTAGYLPFNDQNIAVMYRKICRGQFRLPRWTSPDLRRFISRMLDTNPESRITVDEILRDPWFLKGYREVQCSKLRHWTEPEENERRKSLNAFDLISFSSCLDMSGLFGEPEVSDSVERIVSEETPERIMEKVVEMATAERVRVKRNTNGCGGARLEGQDGNLVIILGIYRLTDELVMVEIHKRETKDGGSAQFWKHKLRPQLLQFVYKPEAIISGDSK
ncbi:hypothetical protein L6164_000179 [Bauhinia variegata]|uniref:Uncharacterized protein n=1 Tax=Bauhinia variegata TaxID=167791 RepID=A0ACB9Q808_BAUVA|nr:hypothetical protein L6164_000179 [Bauhinia variegata]